MIQLLLAVAESRHATGNRELAQSALRAAHTEPARQVSLIPEPNARTQFLTNVAEHSRTVELTQARSQARSRRRPQPPAIS